MNDQTSPLPALEAQLPALPDHVSTSLHEFRATRPDEAGDPQLEAVRAAILIEEVADVVLTDDQIDPNVLADEAAMAAVVRSLRGAL